MIFKKVVLIAISVLSVIDYCSSNSNEVIESNKSDEVKENEVVTENNDVSLNKKDEETSQVEIKDNKMTEANKESVTSSTAETKEVITNPSKPDTTANNNNQSESNKPNTVINESKPAESPVEKPIEKPKNYDIGN